MTPRRRVFPAVSLFLIALTSGCTYLGSARGFDPETFDREPGWLAIRSIRPIRQEGTEDCGLAALQMALAYWEHPVGRAELLQACPLKPGAGLKAGDLRDYAKASGLQAYLIHGEWSDVETELSRGHPIIVGMAKPYVTGVFTHYELVVAVHGVTQDVVTLDPAHGWRSNTFEGFRKEWDPTGRLALILYRAESEASGGK